MKLRAIITHDLYPLREFFKYCTLSFEKLGNAIRSILHMSHEPHQRDNCFVSFYYTGSTHVKLQNNFHSDKRSGKKNLRMNLKIVHILNLRIFNTFPALLNHHIRASY